MNQWRKHPGDWRIDAKKLGDGWRPLLCFDLLFKILSLAVFAPLSALFLGGVLRWSGDRAISNFDLISFFLSPQGLLLIIVSATLGFVVVFFELGGLAMIALAIRDGKRPSAIRTLQFLAIRFRHLCLLGFRQFLILAGIAIIVLVIAVVAKSAFLSDGDINYYLQTKPPEYWIAVSIVGTATLVGGIASLFLLIRWIFSVPLLLTGNRQPREAMRESNQRVRALGTGRVVKNMALWAAGSLTLATASGGTQWALEQFLFAVSGERVGWVIASATLLQVTKLTLGTVVGFVMAVSFAAVIARLFAGISPETKIPVAMITGDAGIDPKRQLRFRWWVIGAVTALTGLAAGSAWLLIDQVQIGDDIAVTAHRGSSLAAPENTRAAIVQAIKDGSDYVEIDVQETADGIVVVIHDTDLRRLAGISQNTWEIPYSEMKGIDIGSWFAPEFSGERILTLRETIELVRGKARLNIELKLNGHDQQLEAAVARIVRETNFEDDCIVMSLDYGAIQKIARLNERLTTGLTLTAGVGDATRFKVDFLAVGASSVTRDLVARAHRAGLEIHVWTVNDPSQMLTMLHLGVDNIITDAPDLLVELLRERAELTNAEKTLLYISDFLAGRL